MSGKVRKFLFSVLNREFYIRYYNILHCLGYKADTRRLDDISNNRLKYVDVRGIRLSFHYNFNEIHISRSTPQDSLSVLNIILS